MTSEYVLEESDPDPRDREREEPVIQGSGIIDYGQSVTVPLAPGSGSIRIERMARDLASRAQQHVVADASGFIVASPDMAPVINTDDVRTEGITYTLDNNKQMSYEYTFKLRMEFMEAFGQRGLQRHLARMGFDMTICEMRYFEDIVSGCAIVKIKSPFENARVRMLYEERYMAPKEMQVEEVRNPDYVPRVRPIE